MKFYRAPVSLFLLAAWLPFVVSFAFFMGTQGKSFLTEPEDYIAILKRNNGASYTIPINSWKYFLARDPLCREAEALVIGSSRVREIDATVVGTSVCNLYVDGLSAPGFAFMAQNLPPITTRQRRIAYVGIDHFWLFWVNIDHMDNVNFKLVSGSGMLRMIWRVGAAIRTLDFFTISDLLEAVRRVRQGGTRFVDQSNVEVWYYPDGHLSYPLYYARKRAGIHQNLSQQEFEDEVSSLYGKERLRESNLHALEMGLRVLHDKGYLLRVFWNPLSPAHIGLARQQFPVLFQQIIDAIDRLASTLPIDRYVPASQTLDASRFGCTERDDYDERHVDVYCLRRIFARVFRDSDSLAD